MFELRTLGTVQLRSADGRLLETLQGRSKRLALLVYLAVDRPAGPKRRDSLLAMFWPEASPDRARHALRQALQTLGNGLGPEVLVGRGTDAVGCNPAELWCDARALERASGAGRHAEVVRLFGGDFLPGLTVEDAPDFDAWVAENRLWFRSRAAEAAAVLADEAAGMDSIDAAVGWAERALELAAEDERALLRLVRLLELQGRHARAREVYETFSQRLLRELGLQPSAATRSVAAELRRGAHSPSSGATAAPVSPPAAKSVAVLPFLNLTGDGEFEYFTDGLTEELIAELSTLPGLAVAARTSSFAFRGRNDDIRVIGNRLGVASVVEASVRRTGQVLRITLQVIDSRDGFHRWADTVEFPFTDALRMPGSLVHRIAPVLHASLVAATGARAVVQTENREAFLAFLRARYHLYRRSPADLLRSVELFEEALSLDPTYAAALGGLALALATLPVYAGAPTATVLPRALEVADQALALDSTLSTAHIARCLALAMYRWDWAGAEASALLAVEGQPPDPIHRSTYAFYVLARDGRFRQALLEAERARDDDPLSLPANAYVGYVAYLARQYALADRASRAALDLDGRFPLALWVREMVLEELGRLDEAVEVARRLVADHPPSLLFRAHLARALARSGRPEARAELERLRASLSPDNPVWYWVGGVHAALGETDLGLTALEHAVDIRSNFLVFAAVHPTLDPLRSHPRFAAILDRMGLPVTLR
jgi:TolB-like protein